MTSILKKFPILITGASGFVGANFAHYFVNRKQSNVHILIRKNSDLWRLKNILSKLKIHYADLRNYRTLSRIIKAIKPGFIFHCAAYGAYRNQKNKRLMWQTNVEGLQHLLKSLSNINYQSFINIGSSSEYGIKHKPMKESDDLRPVSEYGITKALATTLAQQEALFNGKPVTTLRIFSAYGPWENENRLVPYTIRGCLKNERIKIKYPKSVKDFIYIDDVLNCCMQAALKRKSLGILNLGFGKCFSIKKVVELIYQIADKPIKVTWGKRTKKLEPKPWVADMALTRKIIGFKPEIKLQEGLRKTLLWVKLNDYRK